MHDAQPRLEAELDSDPANTSSSHEIAGYAESSATESDQDIGEDSDYVADSSFASSYADSEEDYMGEEQVTACTTALLLRPKSAHNQIPLYACPTDYVCISQTCCSCMCHDHTAGHAAWS